jgi:hypothetical protein
LLCIQDPAGYLEMLPFSSYSAMQRLSLKIRSHRNKHPQYGQNALLGLFLSVWPTRWAKNLSDFWDIFLDGNVAVWYK